MRISNHNGGQLLFGPDRYLYVFTGDGGGGGDPFENGQDRNRLLGKTLRINPDKNGGYTNPSTNPYQGSHAGPRARSGRSGCATRGARSFDRETNALWIADVGQGSFEEINREPGGRRRPQLWMGLPRRAPPI